MNEFTVYCLLNSCFFFSLSPHSETQQGIFDAVLKGHIDFDSDPWPLISDSAKDLIRKMLCSRPSDRLTAHEVLCMFTFLHFLSFYEGRSKKTIMYGFEKRKSFLACWCFSSTLPMLHDYHRLGILGCCPAIGVFTEVLITADDTSDLCILVKT